jgi:choline kinase
MKCLLIQANGNNIRLSKFFKQPKYELYYKDKRIIDTIISNSIGVVDKIYVAVRKDAKLNFDTSNVELIYCNQTTSRLDTLKQCFKFINSKYTSIIIHDCDVIIEKEVLDKLEQNSLAITNYKLDGKKYGFVELDQYFNYLKGNEKETETGHISIGAYSVYSPEFNNYLKSAVDESLLSYYNICSSPTVVYSKQHINLGDINSYINNLWLL